MTANKLGGFTFLAIVSSLIVKLLFVMVLDISNIFILVLFWLLIVIIAIACCRRLGPINYLESFLVMSLWLVISLVIDGIVLAGLAGSDIYKHLYLWISYALMLLAVFLFHKKRHVEIRKELAQKGVPWRSRRNI